MTVFSVQMAGVESAENAFQREEEQHRHNGACRQGDQPGYHDVENDPKIESTDSPGQSDTKYRADQDVGCGNR